MPQAGRVEGTGGYSVGVLGEQESTRRTALQSGVEQAGEQRAGRAGALSGAVQAASCRSL